MGAPIAETAFHLFVYGTLRRDGRPRTAATGPGSAGHDGDPAPAAALLAECEFVCAATVPGTLYDIDGDYPALLLYGPTPVPGEIWRCPARVLPRLDRYEGVDSGLFRRVGVQAGAHPCWTYVAGPALAARLTPARRLASGQW